MRDVGVSSKQTDKARQVFLRSARQANFFEHGEDRLVRPATPAGPGTPPADLEPRKDPPRDPKHGSGSGGGDPPAIDPIIDGLLKRLPKTGDVWPEVDRKLWLQLLEGSFKLIYKDKGTSIPPPPGDAEYKARLTAERHRADDAYTTVDPDEANSKQPHERGRQVRRPYFSFRGFFKNST
jgi:hypothetical protein